ncbi:MAG: type II toxin-antitoxin system RelE/ParE family toxin [Methylococcaceae bacterium]|nr:type II toxin-antitoxin system RelE/ParE family toxin [Methylococcaceae bacterium]MDP3904599.1 type II toxin-antitoxin system RelE/ParE family toxin [Methylococcaceae bacterium]
MTLPVRISEPALLDLLDINDYYLVEVDDKVAENIIADLEIAINSLAELTDRGSVPKELLSLGIRQYRQIIIKPYRIIYEPLPDNVIVHAILDGRRDISSLLAQRLVQPGV